MENMTELTSIMYHSAMNVSSVGEAVAVLRENGHFRTFGDILRAYTGLENPKGMLVDGLMAQDPKTGRDSVDKKVRNWLGGRTRSVSKQDAFALSRVLNLDLEQTDAFLKAVTGEGLHWRNPEEIIWGYGVMHSMSYQQIVALTKRAEMGKTAKTAPAPIPGNFTGEVREKLQPILYLSEEELLAFLNKEKSRLGTFHNTAYLLFMQYMELLEKGSIADGMEDTSTMTSREILESYLYRQLVPVVKRNEPKEKSAFDGVQRSIRMNWPDEATISKMKRREFDVSRKVLILLFLATDGCASEYEEEDEDEDILTRDEVFQNIYSRLNRMLQACGFQMLDPRNPFDWVVLFCICVDDLWDIDLRLQGMLQEIFPDGNEKQ